MSLSVASLPQAMANFCPSCRQLTDSRDKALTKPKDIKDLTSGTSHIINSWVKPITTTTEAISNLSKPHVWEITTTIVSENWTHQSLMLMWSGAGCLGGTTAVLWNMRETLAWMLVWLRRSLIHCRCVSEQHLWLPLCSIPTTLFVLNWRGCDPKMCPRSDRVVDGSEKQAK